MNAFGHDVDPDTHLHDPLALLADWLDRPAGSPPLLTTLATVDDDGAPDARTVMLNAFDGVRLSFHSDTRASKVTQLATDPRAALVVVWPEDARQLVAHGDVVRADDADEAHPDLAPPPTWVCFHLEPRRLTFWRGDDEGPSTRDAYVRTEDGWSHRRLPG
ncbi:pyridoxamine 5'-phosphate oxidase family protein [Mumia sp. DW29H23]|uniref:pyridoxamine 5'-phosphate oxidase family protein n=1 Tax=Mumia sp. DW29H23 TaxID=3421241 RepID=UPI003D69D86B